jgi:tRNA1(Val) A37 N6-methylase TrmN6
MASAPKLDGILNNRVMLEQPANGYRVAIDTVLLAAAVPALAGDRVLDMGCGVGGVLLCLAARVEGVRGTGLEIQPDLADMGRRNIGRNAFAAGLDVKQGDVTQLPPDFSSAFDHVLMNPPYHDEARHDVSANKSKQTANSDRAGDLALWIGAAATALKPSGSLTIIHRADRQHEILSYLQADFGDVQLLPLLPRAGEAAKRVIIRARKGMFFSLRPCRPLVLHKEGGAYTEAAEAILRHAQALSAVASE